MTDEQKDARLWLGSALLYAESKGFSTTVSDRYRAVINAMLDEPRVPDINDHKAIDALVRIARIGGRNICRDSVVFILAALRQPLPPAWDGTIERWAVVSDEGVDRKSVV